MGDWERFSRDVHFSYPLKSSGRFSVETFNGSVDISGWDQNVVDISGTKYGPTQQEADNLRVDIENAADSVSIRVARPAMRLNHQGAKFVVKIPRNARIDRIITSNGSIRTQDGVGSAHLRSSNGGIHVLDLRGDLEAETSNGSIELEGVEGDIRAHSTNGHIRAGRVNGSLDASTSNAGVTAEISRADKPVRISTSNNGVEVTLPPHYSDSVHIETRNAPITLRMAEGTNARLSARTSNSSIDTDYEVRAQGELGRNHLEGVLGNGGPLMELETSNAGIHLVRR